MFQKVFEYAGPHKKGLYAATAIVLVSVLMGVLPFVLAYQVIAPLVMGESIGASFIISRVALVLACLVLQALFYGWGLNLSHKAAYDTLLRLRTALQKRFEKLPLGVIQDKGTGTVKKLFVDDVDSLEVLLAHSMPEGIANLMIPIAVYVAMFFVDWKLALLSLASIPISLIAMMTMYSVGMKKMGPYYMAGQKMNNTIIEYINGMEVVKVFNKDADSYERFRKDVSDYRDYTLAWYKAAWPWMAIYSSLLPCTIILTLPVGAWFVLSGWSTLPNLILVLCLSLSIGMPLLKSLGFLPTMPQLNYKISALPLPYHRPLPGWQVLPWSGQNLHHHLILRQEAVPAPSVLLSYTVSSFGFCHIFFQKFIHLGFRRRTTFQTVAESGGTTSHTQFPGLSAVSLSNTDLSIKSTKQAFLIQHVQGRNQISIAGTAGFYFLCQFRQPHHPVLIRLLYGIKRLIQFPDHCIFHIC